MALHKIGDLFLSHTGKIIGIVISEEAMNPITGEKTYKIQWIDDVETGYITSHQLERLKLNLKRYMDGASSR